MATQTTNPTQDYPGAPELNDVLGYLGSTGYSWPSDDLEAAISAEATDQFNRCRFPIGETPTGTGPVFTPALAEALCRRVAHNLAVRQLPLGVQASMTDGAVSTNFVGGLDAEVRRLEAPYRKRKVG